MGGWQQNFTSIDICTLFWNVIENNDTGRMRVLHFELSFELLISRIKTIHQNFTINIV